MSAGGVAQAGNDFFHRLPRNQVAERLLSGDYADCLSVVLGYVGGKEFFRFKPRGQKVNIVEDRVRAPGLGQHGGQLRLPDALREPSSCRAPAKMVFDVI